MDKFYLTTPIYYVNASAHIGHAYTNVVADCIARFKRIKGCSVFFLTGTDEHGEKIKKAADAAGVSAREFVDKVSGNFRSLWKELDISHDFFVRTTQDGHKKAVQKVIAVLNENGDIYKKDYQGYYCLPCESFWTEKQVEEAHNRCPLCRRAVEEVKEENYFFRLSKYSGWLRRYLEDNPGFIRPQIRYNEVIGFLNNNELADLCISRPKARVSWGVDFPLDDDYVVYVWFDALLNYISAVGFGVDDNKFNKWWPADIHFMAKDILRHHAVFWPIMLKSLGLELPRVIFAHGWWKINDEKMSKSLGNIVNPREVVAGIGIDALRYFLLRQMPLGADGSYSQGAIIGRLNSDLANDLGNLVYRSLNMAQKYFPHGLKKGIGLPPRFAAEMDALSGHYSEFMDGFKLSQALESVFNFIRMINKYIEDTKPWVLFKESKIDDLEGFIYSLLEGIRIISVVLYPFMPRTSSAIRRQLGLDGKVSLDDMGWQAKTNYSVCKEQPLFPRIDVD